MANGTGLLDSTRLCTRCGVERAYERHEWCPACARAWDRERRDVVEREVQCQMCGETFKTSDKRERLFCDRKCKSLYRKFSNYGITPFEYEQLLERQNGTCAICDRTSADVLGRALVVDHDHLTGEVRGLLCSGCNSGIGHFRDNPLLMERAIRYLTEEV